MKRFLFLAALFFCLSAINAQKLSKEIGRAFALGNAEIISGNMDNSIELYINGLRERVLGAQAVERLNRFMEEALHPQFTLVHESERSDVGFIIGNLKSAQSTSRVNISFDKVDGKEIIQTIRIEALND